MPFLSLSLPQTSLQCQLCFSLFLPPPHRVLPHSRARRHSGLLIHTDTCGCAVSSSGRAVAWTPCTTPLAATGLYQHHLQSLCYHLIHLLQGNFCMRDMTPNLQVIICITWKMIVGVKSTLVKGGENNQPPLTGCVDHCWLQATFKKGYSVLLCLYA